MSRRILRWAVAFASVLAISSGLVASDAGAATTSTLDLDDLYPSRGTPPGLRCEGLESLTMILERSTAPISTASFHGWVAPDYVSWITPEPVATTQVVVVRATLSQQHGEVTTTYERTLPVPARRGATTLTCSWADAMGSDSVTAEFVVFDVPPVPTAEQQHLWYCQAVYDLYQYTGDPTCPSYVP